MAAIVVLGLVGTAAAASYNYSASLSSTAQFANGLVLCNTTFAAANATGLYYTTPSFDKTANYGVGFGLAQNTKYASQGVGLQASLMVYPGTKQYLTNENLGYEVCALAMNVRALSENTILLGQNDTGTCATMLSNGCINDLKSTTNAIAATAYNNTLGKGSVSSMCQSIQDQLQQSLPNSCKVYFDPSNQLIVGNVPISQLPASQNNGFNESALAVSCTVTNGYELWYNINTELSGGYSDSTYDAVTTAIWPIFAVFTPPLNTKETAIISTPETDLTCLHINHYNPGSRVSPAQPAGTPYNTTASATASATATATPSAGISGGAIAGIVIGVLAIIFIVLGAIWFFRRRRRATKETEPEAVEIYTKEHKMDRKYSEAPSANYVSEMSPDTHKAELPGGAFSAELQGDHHYELEGQHTIHELPANNDKIT
ncbi:hypothetical protein AMS68_005384 [Peltaster fructicola]|uniref:Ig-like domain-containing protein n=1 Tax=Peltaster fructicola TaxID=286661 RepID=A0A6H0XYP5_9PEZI|nr:hypothetical protein AMS68_005384 [Peltaster fructicola]